MGNIFDIRGLGQSVAAGIPDPGPGNEISIVVPTEEIWLITGITFLFTADATIANRNYKLTWAQQNQVIRAYSDRPMPANQIERHDWLLNRQSYYITTGNYPAGSHNYQLPEMMLDGSATPGVTSFQTNTNNLQAGDTYTGIDFFYKRWRI